MGTRGPILSNALYCASLLLLISLGTCRTEEPIAISELIQRVNDSIENRTVIPFCFVVNLEDLTCFWESNTSEASAFTMHYIVRRTFDHSKYYEVACNLSTLSASEESRWHVCHFSRDDVSLFAPSPISISVRDNQSNRTYRRMVRPEKIVYTEPPTNITVTEQKNPLGLNILFKNPEKNEDLKDTVIYQVDYRNPKGHNSIIFNKVSPEDDNVTLFLGNVLRGVEYTISVRAKAGEPHGGYWSAWAVTTFQTSSGFDTVHIVLFVVAGVMVVTAMVFGAVYQKRFLKSKMWPDVPTPEHHFKELYTTHKGNFKTWLGQTDSYLMWISRNIFYEGPITTLEVLSELPKAPPSFVPPVPLPPKDSYVALDENILPPLLGMWTVSPRHDGMQRVQSGQLDDENAIRREEWTQEEEGRPEEPEAVIKLTALEEPAIGGTEIMTLKGPPSMRTTLRGDSLSSEEGKQSTGSSFEYTVLETCDGLLSPRTRSIPPRQPLKYAYLAMSESGEESPPPSPNIYQNSPCGQFPAPVYSQC